MYFIIATNTYSVIKFIELNLNIIIIGKNIIVGIVLVMSEEKKRAVVMFCSNILRKVIIVMILFISICFLTAFFHVGFGM